MKQIQQIYATYDKKANIYLPIFTMDSHAVAERSVFDGLYKQYPDGELFVHANDYALYVLGEFNSDTGEIRVSNPAVVAELGAIRNMVIEARNELMFTVPERIRNAWESPDPQTLVEVENRKQ